MASPANLRDSTNSSVFGESDVVEDDDDDDDEDKGDTFLSLREDGSGDVDDKGVF